MGTSFHEQDVQEQNNSLSGYNIERTQSLFTLFKDCQASFSSNIAA